jgi:hypothetical protein
MTLYYARCSNGVSASAHTCGERSLKCVDLLLVGGLCFRFLLLLLLGSSLRRLLLGRLIGFSLLCSAHHCPGSGSRPAPLPASSSAIAPIAALRAAPLAAPVARPPFTCLALSTAACRSAFLAPRFWLLEAEHGGQSPIVVWLKRNTRFHLAIVGLHAAACSGMQTYQCSRQGKVWYGIVL